MRTFVTRLVITPLERRDTPAAAVTFFGGHLTVRGDDGGNTVDLVRTAVGVSVSVTDGSGTANYGVYAVTGHLTVRTGSASDTVNYSATAATPLPGHLTIVTGNGINAVNLMSTGTSAGTIAGRLFISTGTGDDSIELAGDEEMIVGGHAVIDGGSGFDECLIRGNGPARFASSLRLLRVNDRGLFSETSKIAVAGDLTFDTTGDGGLASNLEIVLAEIGGRLVMTLGSGSDTVTVGPAVTVGGDAVVNLGQSGPDLQPVSFDGVEIGGDLTLLGGDGDDGLFFNQDVVIGGGAVILAGHGNNGYSFDAGIGQIAVSVGGDFTLRAGNGDDSILDADGFGFRGLVGGDMLVDLGHGDNAFQYAAEPGATVNGRFTYQGGSGEDLLVIRGTHTFALRANLGAGADTFAFAGSTAPTLGAATIDFGVDFDDDVYTQGSVAVVSWPQVLLNLP